MKRIVFDRRSLIVFYLIGILYILTPTHFYGSFFHWLFQGIYIAWTALILIHDLLKKQLRWDPVLILWDILILWAAVSYIFQQKGHGIYPLIHFFTLVMMVHVFYSAPSRMDQGEGDRFAVLLGRMIIVVVTVLNLASIGYYLLRDTVNFPQWWISRFNVFTERHGILRYAGIYFHPVLGGEKLVTAVLFSLMLREKKALSIPAALIAVITSGIMLYLGNSRTAILQVLFCAVWLLGCRLCHDRKQAVRYILVILFGTLIAGTIIVRIKMPEGINYESLNYLSSNRLKLWSTAFAEFLKRPFLGWGWENGDAVAPYTGSNLEDCHNIIFNLLLWTGIPGTAAFIGAVALWIINLCRNSWILLDRSNQWYALFTLCFLLQALLDPLIVGEDIRIGTPLFWLFAGIVYYRGRKHA